MRGAGLLGSAPLTAFLAGGLGGGQADSRLCLARACLGVPSLRCCMPLATPCGSGHPIAGSALLVLCNPPTPLRCCHPLQRRPAAPPPCCPAAPCSGAPTESPRVGARAQAPLPAPALAGSLGPGEQGRGVLPGRLNLLPSPDVTCAQPRRLFVAAAERRVPSTISIAAAASCRRQCRRAAPPSPPGQATPPRIAAPAGWQPPPEALGAARAAPLPAAQALRPWSFFTAGTSSDAACWCPPSWRPAGGRGSGSAPSCTATLHRWLRGAPWRCCRAGTPMLRSTAQHGAAWRCTF